MVDERTAVEAARILKRYCYEKDACKHCVFAVKTDTINHDCRLGKYVYKWIMPVIWEHKDVAMAKALKLLNITHIKVNENESVFLFSDDRLVSTFPFDVFGNAEKDVLISLDDIIREAETKQLNPLHY